MVSTSHEIQGEDAHHAPQSAAGDASGPVRRPLVYIFTALGSIYTDGQHLHQVPQPHELGIMLSACRKPFSLKVGDEQRTLNAALVSDRLPRWIDARGTQHLTVRIAPLHRSFTRLAIGRPIHELDRESFASLQDAMEAAVHGELSYPEARRLSIELVRRVADTFPPAPEPDPRLPEIIQMLRDNPLISLESLAQAVDLSPSRLSHLFSESFGMPIRSFLIWRRIARALWLLVVDRSLSMTEVAYQLGFSDSSHFARTFFQFTGYTPSQVRASNMRIITG